MNCPSHKTCHQTKQQARKQLVNSERRGAPKLKIYECPLCGYFHVSSSLERKNLHK
jgi:hypothetical protein